MFKKFIRAYCLKYAATHKRSYKELIDIYIDFSAGVIREDFKAGKINFREALYLLDVIGYAPNVLNDDNYRWAVCYDGFQTVPNDKEKKDIHTAFVIEKDQWQNSIEEALIYSLKDDI